MTDKKLCPSSSYDGWRWHPCGLPTKRMGAKSNRMLCGRHAAGEDRQIRNRNRWKEEDKRAREIEANDKADARIMCIHCRRPWAEGEGPST